MGSGDFYRMDFYRMNDDEDWSSPSSERRRQSGDTGAWERDPTSWMPRRHKPGQEPLFRQRRAAKEQSENSSGSSESSTDGSGTTSSTSNSSGGGKRKRRGTNV